MSGQVYNEDCISGMAKQMKDESVHCCITSIPFGALFSYSGKSSDIGNNLDGIEMHEGQFGLHMRFFIEQLFRVLKPGSIACIHIQQLLTYKVQHGYMGMRDFRGAIITLMKNHSFQPHGEVAIPKNPQAVATRLKLHSLMFITGKKDSRKLVPAMNDYILFFKKPGDGEPVRGLYDEKVNPDGWFTQEEWIKWARGCWDDILEIDTLEGWRCAKEDQEEKHVCPLQLEPVRRCVKLYTKPGDIVLDPFMGIGTVGYVAIEQGRHTIGFELKESYHRMALANIEKIKNQQKTPQLGLFAE
jgi:DNA modification methylase